ncbi:hypothetical protein NCAS_0G01660 [Naumovozyma castellii]|uniref:RRM domain-containing protein n=1 Tax=Naumovozyma castellii TaxID=27288 RepID=G0VI19_NAUCA|nr:hypothetical protein NCAS_0G01660 [Naumovozyma castellii CBS 4309]CCC71053.1 hypothetical protein NCAS_0G01660 [Naumovozyma castellii CBS 4309]
MQNSNYLFQKPFSASTENLSFGSVNNLSPSHQATLNLNSSTSIRSNSDTNINFNAILSSQDPHTFPNTVASPLFRNMSTTDINLTDSTTNRKPGYIIKLFDLPQDITQREAYAIFALASGIKEIQFINSKVSSSKNSSPLKPDTINEAENTRQQTVNGNLIIAKLDSLPLAIQYASILNSKTSLFGSKFPSSCSVEVIDTLTNQQISISKGNPTSQKPSASPQHTQKRPSVLQSAGGAGSRFSFNDPFSSDYNQFTIPQSASSQQQQPLQSNTINRSFLSLEPKDINENIWNATNDIPSSNSGFAPISKPSTPTVEWGAPSSSRSQSTTFFDITHNNVNRQIPTGSQQQQQQQQMQSFNPVNMNTSLPESVNQPQLLNPGQTFGQNGTNDTMDQNALASGQMLHGKDNKLASNMMNPIDISLLARIPPPANPADQNPPCNTLYVGNLPADCTEQELRLLFSNQPGFKRLSFRIKNSKLNPSSSNTNASIMPSSSAAHGPMCFVEFEDISYATMALAELYGAQLPRATTSTKGGIRLSFSKNPLGVRGPNNRRNPNAASTHNNIPTSLSSNMVNNNPNNSFTGYGR